jgi:hypothetical protein
MNHPAVKEAQARLQKLAEENKIEFDQEDIDKLKAFGFNPKK